MKTKRQIGAVLLTLSLVMFAEGCRKKGPAPPPPPAPAPRVQEQPKPKPVITSLTVDPSSIERGQSATLRWSSQNATSGTIDNGIGSVDPNGSRQVSPSSTTTYKLTVTGEGGEATQSVTLRVTEPAPAAPPPPPTAPKATIRELVEQMIKDAYFDYDKSDIREDARNQLQQNADALKNILRQVSGTVVIEGHCDERGSAEYNLGLGDRRSTSARDFLVQLGVPADRLRVVSYGKERPQCTESNESCWQKNRRAHFVGVE